MHQSFVVLSEGRAVAGGRGGPGVEALACKVIAMLRVRDGRAMPLDEARIAQIADRLIAAALSHEGDALTALAAALRAEGLPLEALVDCVMPEAARELGRAWDEDRLSFVHVTLAMTRFQRLLRDAVLDAPADGQGASILFVVPEGEQHTLGALVAAQQLRRMGFGACLALGEKPRIVAEMLRARRFDAVFVSVATRETLENARRLMTFLRSEDVLALPVVVGGAVLCGTDRATRDRFRDETGATVVSNDLCAVLNDLKLTPRQRMRAETA